MSTMTRVLQIRPSSSCKGDCAFCSAAGADPQADMTLDEIRRNLDHFVDARGVREVVVSGGEITHREDFAELMALLESKPLDHVALISSGLQWTDEQMERAGRAIDRVILSITPWSSVEAAGSASRVDEVYHLAERLSDAGITVQTNTVVLRGNLQLLRALFVRIAELGLRGPRLTFPFPHGRTRERFQELVPAWGEARGPIFALLDEFERFDPRLVNLPLCYLDTYRRFCRPTTVRILVEKGRQLQDHAVIPPFIGKGHLPVCQTCEVESECDGFWSFYLEQPGMFPPLRALERDG